MSHTIRSARRSYERDAQSGRYRSPGRSRSQGPGASPSRHVTVKGPTLKGRSTIPFSRPSSAPGPGAYSPQRVGPGARKAGPAFSIGSRHHGHVGEFHPGPGAYYPERSGEIVRRRAGFSFGTRHHSMDDRSPGPAAYHPHGTRAGRAGVDVNGPRLATKSSWPIDGRIRSDPQGHGYYDDDDVRRRHHENYQHQQLIHPVDHRYDHQPRYHGSSQRYQYVTDGGRAGPPPHGWDPYYHVQQRGGRGHPSPYGEEYYHNGGGRRQYAVDDYRPSWGASRGRVLGPVGTGAYYYQHPPPPDDVRMSRAARGQAQHPVRRAGKSATQRRQQTRPPDR